LADHTPPAKNRVRSKKLGNIEIKVLKLLRQILNEWLIKIPIYMQVKFAERARAKHPNVRRKQKPQQLNFDWTLQTGRPNCFIMYKGFLAMSKQNHCKLHTTWPAELFK